MAHRYQEFDWYETPLYYDIVFDAETENECDFIEVLLEVHGTGLGSMQAGRRRYRILEPACGTGRLVAGMARRGHDVLGFDLSQGALAFARQRIALLSAPGTRRAGRTPGRGRARRPTVRLRRGAMQSFKPPGRFDLAHCLVSSFRYLHTESDARRHLECVAQALRPGGLYVLGLHLTEYGHDAPSRERWVGSRRGVHVVCNIQGWPAERRRRRERMRTRLVVSKRGAIARYETSWEFRTYSVRQLRALIASVPALEHIATYDFDYDLERVQELGAERLDQVLVLRRA